MLIDAHSHLDKYGDEEIGDVLETIAQDRILTFSVAIDVDSFLRTELIAAQESLVIPGFGIHPSEATRYVDGLDDVEALVARSPFIGEIGLDHEFVTDSSQYGAQRMVFDRFLAWAAAESKLVNLHCTGAEQDTADMLGESGVERVIVHWYAGPLDVLAQLAAIGCMFTVGVELLHSEHIRDVARAIPSRQLLTETDNPGGQRWLTGESGYPPSWAPSSTNSHLFEPSLQRSSSPPCTPIWPVSFETIVTSNRGWLTSEEPPHAKRCPWQSTPTQGR
ncbi:TatD family hydrolase [soil metagenome]